MQKIPIILVFVILFTHSAFSQQFKKPSEGKSLVYFVRYRGAVALIDFKYFDGEKYLGRVNGNTYLTYECEPGEHVFWVSAENKEFIRGDLKPNATYVIEVRPYYRAVMSGVEFSQVSPNDKKTLKSISKVLEKDKPAEMKGGGEDQSSLIANGMERYNAIKSKVIELNGDWIF